LEEREMKKANKDSFEFRVEFVLFIGLLVTLFVLLVLVMSNRIPTSTVGLPTTIGILGGIGPGSSIEFQSRLIAEFQERGLIKSNTDYPHYVLNSIPAPEPVGDNLDLTEYINGVNHLEFCRSSFVVMICNTIHLHHEKLQKNLIIPIINLREEVKEYLEKEGVEFFTVLGTMMVLEKGLFHFSGTSRNELLEHEIVALEEAIFAWNMGQDKEHNKDIVIDLAKKYSKDSTILAACTEVSCMLEGSGIPFVDTMDILVDAVVEKYLEIKNRGTVQRRTFPAW